MMQLGNVFGGRWEERKKWGYHIPESWKLFFDTGRAIGLDHRRFQARGRRQERLGRRRQFFRRRQDQG